MEVFKLIPGGGGEEGQMGREGAGAPRMGLPLVFCKYFLYLSLVLSFA